MKRDIRQKLSGYLENYQSQLYGYENQNDFIDAVVYQIDSLDDLDSMTNEEFESVVNSISKDT